MWLSWCCAYKTVNIKKDDANGDKKVTSLLTNGKDKF